MDPQPFYSYPYVAIYPPYSNCIPSYCVADNSGRFAVSSCVPLIADRSQLPETTPSYKEAKEELTGIIDHLSHKEKRKRIKNKRNRMKRQEASRLEKNQLETVAFWNSIEE